MWPYWLLFLIPAFQAVTKLRPAVQSPLGRDHLPFAWWSVFVSLVLMIGLRHEVGGDWANYLKNLDEVKDFTLEEALAAGGDPLYRLLNWLAADLELGIYILNSVYAVLFSWGALIFCRNQPRPWLALTVAVPYLITVVAMGYSRQGVAIGLAMLGFVALNNKSTIKFLLWIALAAMFHKSVIILVPAAALVGTRRWVINLFIVGMTFGLLFVLLLQEAIDTLKSGYILAEYESSGAAIRIAMNALPAALFLLFRRRFHLTPVQRTFWTWGAWSALAFVVLLYVSPSSTAVDRVALYWIPLQLFVWSRIPDAMGRPGSTNAGWVFAVVSYSAAVHFVWLFFATHASLWLPYKFYPWVWLWQ